MDVVYLRFIRKGSWDWCLSTRKGRKQDWAEVEVELWCSLYGAPRQLCGCSEAPMSLHNCPTLRKGGRAFISPHWSVIDVGHPWWGGFPSLQAVPEASGQQGWTLAGLLGAKGEHFVPEGALGSTSQPTIPGECLAQRELSVNVCWMNEPNQSLGTDLQGTYYIVTFTRSSKKWSVH